MATELDRLIVRIEADLASLKRGLGNAERATSRSSRRMERSFRGLDASIGRTIAAVGNLRNVLLGFGAIQIGRSIIGDFAAFEKGLIGVGKTTSLAGAELDALGRDIQDLAQRVPEATTTLLEIAKSAGQLGVQGRNNIVKFTEVIGKLGGATDLSGEAAASTLARLLNITKTSISDIDRLGASIVDLGNNFAATEAEIADVALRVARGTAPFRVSLADTLAIATALRAVGVEAEAGGSVILRAFQQINKGLEQGGDELAALVAITGRSVDELKEQFGRDATEAFLQFVEASGEIATNKLPAFLELMGLEGVRAAGILQALAGRSDELRRALEVSNRAWEENTALNIEAERALEGLSAQWQLTLNAVERLSTAIGALLAPSVKDLIGDIGDLANSLADAVTQLDAFFDRIANSPLGKFISEINKLDPTRLAFEALTAPKEEGFPAEGLTIPLPPPLPASRQGTRNPPLPGGGDKKAETARQRIEDSIRALEDEARIASTAASQRDELRAILALENAARAANVTLTDKQLERARAAIRVTQQQAIEEEKLDRIRAAETGLGEELEELQLRLRFSGEETEAFRVQLRLLELRRDLESEITPEMAAQVRQVEALTSQLEDLNRIREVTIRVNEEIERSALDLDTAFQAFSGSVTTAFENAIIEGERFSDVLDALEDQIIGILARVLISEPLERGLRTGLGAFVPPAKPGEPAGIEGLVGGGLSSLANLFPSEAPGVGLGTFNRLAPTARQDVFGGGAVDDADAIFGSLAGAAEEAAGSIEGLGLAGGAAGGLLDETLAPAALEAATETLTETAVTGSAITALTSLTVAAGEAATALTFVAAASSSSLSSTAAADVSNPLLAGIFGSAAGGHVSGPGGPRDDRIPAMLSDGEFVVNAAMTRKHRGLLEAINGGRLRRLVEGGIVMPPEIPRGAARGAANMPAAGAAAIGERPIVININNPNSVPEIQRNMAQIRGSVREMLDQANRRDR